MARPSKLDEQVRSDLARLLATGVDAETAARAAGITLRTFNRWLARGEALRAREEDGKRIRPEDRKYLELLDDIESAFARLEAMALANIQKAGATHWQASAWMLEHLKPERYAPQRRQQGRPPGATSAPDRPSTGSPAPPRVRLRSVK